jgi:GEVED domain/Pregnancy-associated plasma protein-A/Secretion system C-terminal sorting domain/Fibronectin type III domain
MLNKQILVFAAMLFGSLTASAQHRSCAANDVLEHQKHNDAFLEQRMEAIEQHTQNHAAHGIQSRANVTIPVVVHVLYNNTTTNISDAQILSQIAVLNADFAASNADYSLVPAAFTAVRSGNTGIQFCMAKRDPQGNATTGINRKATTKASFEANTDDAKSATTGVAAWPAGQYLNIWVVPSITSGGQSGILGYAQFPGGAAATDGLVIGYNYFGNTGTVAAPYNKGRTATHEIGHWLNLRHIWGDANCGSDLVTDTPTHNDANYGCPAAGHKSTCTGTPVEMTMNYMDYTDDACMYMFSAGQKTRMDALFATGGSRASLATSQGCVAPTGGTTCNVATALSSSSVTASSATLSWGAATGASSYTLQYKTAAATTWTTVTGVGTPTWTLTGLTAATTYNFQVATVCGTTTTAYSTAASFTTLATGAVSYCASVGTSSADEFINTVRFAKTATPTTYVINNTSGNNAGYGNFTGTTVNVQRGTGYTITVVPGWTSTVYSEGYKVWVDWNRDGDFLDAGENVYTKATSTATPATGAFTIPATAALGATRMRVQMKYNSSTITSCETLAYGEVEDYTLNVAITARESAPATADETAIAPMDLVVFPNPVTAELNLVINQFDGNAVNATLTSITGAAIDNFKITASSSVIDVAHLPAGMYFVTLYGADKQVVTRKFIKE